MHKGMNRRQLLISANTVVAATGLLSLTGCATGTHAALEGSAAQHGSKRRGLTGLSFADVVREVRGAPNRGIYFVATEENLEEPILRCDEIIFGVNSLLNLNALRRLNVPFVAICARKYKFVAPTNNTIIQRPDGMRGPSGGPGGVGGRGPDGANDGDWGSPGGVGGAGSDGSTTQLCPIYFFGEECVRDPGAPTRYLTLKVSVPGVSGGAGGLGGRGGQGGDGHSGTPGADALAWCSRGPGNGGWGGNGGPGGVGGRGGRGGDGAEVYFCGPKSFLNVITMATVDNSGGRGGVGAEGGRGGPGGSGATRGAQTAFCHGGSDGLNGGEGPHGRGGRTGENGAKGLAQSVEMQNLDVLY